MATGRKTFVLTFTTPYIVLVRHQLSQLNSQKQTHLERRLLGKDHEGFNHGPASYVAQVLEAPAWPLFPPFSIGLDDVVGVTVVDVVLEVFRIIAPPPPPKQQHEVSRSWCCCCCWSSSCRCPWRRRWTPPRLWSSFRPRSPEQGRGLLPIKTIVLICSLMLGCSSCCHFHFTLVVGVVWMLWKSLWRS